MSESVTEAERCHWLTVGEVCVVAKCGRKLIYRAVGSGRLRAARISPRRDIRIRRDWVEQWLEACSTPVEITR